MILRRVIEHFRRQEWTAIFLDFVIVVVGILIAFQITEWNAARRDRTLEREYLERIYADVVSTLAARGEPSDWDIERKAQQALVLKTLRTGALAEEDRAAFDMGLAYFGFVSGVEVQWATVEELKSTGAMNLIRDVSLRSRILQVDADITRRQAIATKFMESIYAHREQLSGRYGVEEFAGERENVRLNYDFGALAVDPAVANTLSQIDFLARFRNELNEPTMQQLSELRDELARTLGKEPTP